MSWPKIDELKEYKLRFHKMTVREKMRLSLLLTQIFNVKAGDPDEEVMKKMSPDLYEKLTDLVFKKVDIIGEGNCYEKYEIIFENKTVGIQFEILMKAIGMYLENFANAVEAG